MQSNTFEVVENLGESDLEKLSNEKLIISHALKEIDNYLQCEVVRLITTTEKTLGKELIVVSVLNHLIFFILNTLEIYNSKNYIEIFKSLTDKSLNLYKEVHCK